MTKPEPPQEKRNVHSLREHPEQPRLDIDTDSESFQELVASVRLHGVLEPLLITPDGFVLAGKRRRKAAIAAGVKEVPVYVRPIGDHESAIEIMLAENMARQSLSPLEEAIGMEKVMKLRGLSAAEYARRLETSASNISMRLAILKCCEAVRQMFHKDLLPIRAASYLAKVEDEAKQTHLAGQVARRDLTVEDLKEIALAPPKKAARGRAAAPPPPPPEPAAKKKKDAKAKPKAQTAEAAPITRATALKALNGANGRKIAVHTVAVLLDQACSACEMLGQETVCAACPLPKFAHAIAGRAS